METQMQTTNPANAANAKGAEHAKALQETEI